MLLDVYRYGLILWLAIPTPSECISYFSTALAIKQGLQDYTTSMPLGTNGYLDMVKNSKIFVDNTLFIKDIIEKNHKSKLIISPRKLGKTTNLLMLKTFLQPEVNDQGEQIARERTVNYKLFMNGEVTMDDGGVQKLQSSLLISQHKPFCYCYLGKYPVIYVTFKDAIGENFTDIINQIEYSIMRAFHDHRYMIPVLERANRTIELKTFKEYLYRETQPDYKAGLKFLAHILHMHFQHRVFLLLDDYDIPLYNVFRVGHFKKKIIGSLVDYLHAIIAITLKEGNNILQDITTTCFELERHIITPWYTVGRSRIVEEKDSLQRYFGFSQNVVEQLFRLHNISESLRWFAYRWYYAHTFQHTQERYYHPSSIVSFLHHKKIDIYWEDNSNMDALNNILINSQFMRQAVIGMLSKRSFLIHVLSSYTKDHLYHLQDAFVGKPRHICGIFALSYLRNLGYLIRGRGIVEYERCLITNHELASVLAKKLMWSYKTVYKLDTELIHDTVSLLGNFIADDYFDTSDRVIGQLQSSILHLYLNSRRKHAHVNCSTLVYIMLTSLLLHIQCVSKFQLSIYYKGILGPDFVIYDDKKLFVTVITFQTRQEPSELALQKAMQYRNVSSVFPNATELRFIGIHVDTGNETVHIMTCREEKLPGLVTQNVNL